ncbi:MAG: hypothetical protein C4321_09355 [Chloroflexota bacterium]
MAPSAEPTSPAATSTKKCAPSANGFSSSPTTPSSSPATCKRRPSASKNSTTPSSSNGSAAARIPPPAGSSSNRVTASLTFHGAADIGPIGQAAALHLQVVVPNFGVQEWTDFTQNAAVCEVFPTPAEFRDGYAQPPERPGIGVDINEEAARRYPYQRAFMPLVRLTDGSVHVY